MKIQSIRGTNDILPGSVELWRGTEETARRLFRLYGYGEVRTPALEETELFVRSIGLETDIVQKEMYTLSDSKGKNISLRPEGTAPVMRAYIQHSLYHDKAIKKLYYVGSMFRRERPQKGRYRQFHQIGAEVLGTDHPAVEAEAVQMLRRFFSDIGLKGLRLLINSVGCMDCRPSYLEKLKAALAVNRADLCGDCQQRSSNSPLRVFDCKVASCQPLIDQLPKIIDHLCPTCSDHFTRFRQYLDALSERGETDASVEPRLVRGLDYYVGTTFEMVSPDLGPTQNAVAGGGRYDGLSEILGGPPTKGFGFAVGMERLILLLSEEESLATSYQAPQPDLFLICMEEAYLQKCLELAGQLRRQGIFVQVDFEGRSLKAQMRLANRVKARFTCVIGEQEIESGRFTVKRMEDGQQSVLQSGALAAHIRE